MPETPRVAAVAGLVVVAGWAAVACAGGGIDFGDGLGGAGATAAFAALAVGAPLAAALLLAAGGHAVLRAWPTRLALACMAGLAAWSALSIAWADAPDLAWVDTNRQAIALCALVAGISLGAILPGAPRLFGLGLAAAAVPAVALALGTKVLPTLLGSDNDLARLAEPVGYWNALALVAVMAVPGLLWLAGGTARRAWGPPLAGAGLCLVVVTVLLTYSRGGLLSLIAAVAVTLAFLPRRGDGIAAVAAGTLGAVLPAAYALTDAVLSADQVPTGVREGPGGGLGWRLAVGVAAAALLTPALGRLLARLGADPARARRVVAVVALVAVVAAAGAFAASGGARSWAGDRVAEFRGEGGDAVANDPGRLVNASGNQRRGWWEEAWRAFERAPVAGTGAGGFPLVHLRERTSGDDALNTRESHDIVLRTLSGTGLVGLALLIGLVVAVVAAALRAADRHPGADIGLPLAVLAAFALQAAVDWSWAIPALTIPALGAAGVVLAAAAPGPAAPGRGRSRAPRPAVAGAVAALAAVAVLSAGLPWWSGRAAREGSDALAAGNSRRAVALARDARVTNPLAVAPLLLLGQAYTDQRDLPRALGAYEAATRLQPGNPATWRALAIFLGPDRSATAAWRRVHALDPQDPEAARRAS